MIAASGAAPATLDGLELIPGRRLFRDAVTAWFELAPGDRPLVAPGDAVAAGDPLAERLRATKLAEVVVPAGSHELVPGERWTGGLPTALSGARRRREDEVAGEVLFGTGDRWRIATGDHHDVLESPGAGIVREVQPGVGMSVALSGRGITGSEAIGAPSRGRLEIATGPEGELRPGALDVGRAGTILVVGSRIDAEALTRARAMGVRGIVVSGLASKDWRDLEASERRQRAALHALPAFAVLVLDCAARRPISSPVMALLDALSGREVAIVGDPPLLLVDAPDVELPAPPADWVRVRHGERTGREGRFLGPAGLRRFRTGAHLESAFVRLDSGPPVALPIADLERFR